MSPRRPDVRSDPATNLRSRSTSLRGATGRRHSQPHCCSCSCFRTVPAEKPGLLKTFWAGVKKHSRILRPNRYSVIYTGIAIATLLAIVFVGPNHTIPIPDITSTVSIPKITSTVTIANINSTPITPKSTSTASIPTYTSMVHTRNYAPKALIANARAWSAQVDPLTETYNGAYPQHFHTKNAYTALGIPEPAFERWVAHRDVVRAAHRKLALQWHPDKWQVRGLPNRTVAEAIYELYSDAVGRFDDYHESPNLWFKDIQRFPERGLLVPIPHVRNGITLPHYSTSVNCTVASTISAALGALFTAPEEQARMPATDTERSAYYPCSLSKVLSDKWARLQRSNIPSIRIDRYWHTPEIRNASVTNWKWWLGRVGNGLVLAKNFHLGTCKDMRKKMKSGWQARWLSEDDYSHWGGQVCEPDDMWVEDDPEPDPADSIEHLSWVIRRFRFAR